MRVPSFILFDKCKKSAKCNVAKRCQSVCCLSHTRAVGFWIRILMQASSNRSGWIWRVYGDQTNKPTLVLLDSFHKKLRCDSKQQNSKVEWGCLTHATVLSPPHAALGAAATRAASCRCRGDVVGWPPLTPAATWRKATSFHVLSDLELEFFISSYLFIALYFVHFISFIHCIALVRSCVCWLIIYMLFPLLVFNDDLPALPRLIFLHALGCGRQGLERLLLSRTNPVVLKYGLFHHFHLILILGYIILNSHFCCINYHKRSGSCDISWYIFHFFGW